MTKYFADVSSYQRDDLDYFQGLVNDGVSSVFIKTTQGSPDGDNYLNPKSLNQTKNALAAGMNVGFYHYLKASSVTDAINEAKFFEQSVVNLGFSKNTPLCVDVEDPSLSTLRVASFVDTFINYLKVQGYNNIVQYSMASWFNSGILDATKYPTWVASYGGNECGARGNIVGWQFTDKWSGMSLDMSYDWGIFNKQPVVKTEPVTQAETIAEKSTVEDVIKLTADTKAVDRLGIERPLVYKKDTVWKSADIVMINDEPHYLIGTNIYIPISKTTFNDFIIVKYIDNNPAPLFNNDGKLVINEDVTTGKGFKTNDIKIINNIVMVEIATNQYIPMEYTSGSKFE